MTSVDAIVDGFTHSFEPFQPKRKHFRNITGRRFGRLTVISIYCQTPHPAKITFWLCRCDCGTWRVLPLGRLTLNQTRSCGCYSSEAASRRATVHGGSGMLEYKAFRSAKQRCVNPKVASYPRYGGRGIEFRFTSFQQFLDELGPRPSKEYSLDRIDNDGHYEPGNVRWATQIQQERNKSTNRLLTYNNVTMTEVEWANLKGGTRSMISHRLANGWCEPCSITIPPQTGPRGRHAQSCQHRGIIEMDLIVEDTEQ
jgi:hypothetical protein